MSSNQEEYELCMRTEGVQLPKNGFFGITAATGGLAGLYFFKYSFEIIILIFSKSLPVSPSCLH